MRFFFPKKVDFFEIFDRAALNLTKASERLIDLLENFTDVKQKTKEIYDIEQDGDILTHDIMRRLHSTFLTPIDREDIHALASGIDDVLDFIWGCVDRLNVFNFPEVTKEAIQLAKDLHITTETIQKAMKKLKAKEYPHVQELCIEINRLENRIDRAFRDALGKLFEDYKNDPVMIIKWKEIYEYLEEASDKCEDVANILEGIVLKHA